jgi:phosphatidylserine/phosphatidylglycerophosphate/cardiolipin synthase-like enzyme
MSDELMAGIERLIRAAPVGWLTSACDVLRSCPATVSAEAMLQRMPSTNNADLSYLLVQVVHEASLRMSWEALGWTLQVVHASYRRWRTEQALELIWSGPSPAERIPARRIDQALYDLVLNAKKDILLVTFAAAKIERLGGELLKAAQRHVRIRLILEFEQTSEGQLSWDAIDAFRADLIAAANVYYWPVEKRERNQAGRPGKLHAKVAIVDDTVLLSSANLTDDAFNRNLEVGIMVKNAEFLMTIKDYIDSLIAHHTFRRLQ